jgi:hypothetical protein
MSGIFTGFSIKEITDMSIKVLDMNKDCFLAQYFIKNPDVNPKDVVMYSKQNADGSQSFWIEYKRLGRT